MNENIHSLILSASVLAAVIVGVVQGLRARLSIDGAWAVLLLACGVGAVVGVGASLGLADVTLVSVLRGGMAGILGGCMAVGGMTALDRLRKPVVPGGLPSAEEPKEEAVK